LNLELINGYVKAVYLAFFRLEEQKTIGIGALAELEFKPGIYIYAGSAMTNVEKRLKRHFSETENRYWHIDYFSAEAEPLDYFILPENSEYECKLADIMEEVAQPVHSFGASDCSCGSHLFRVD
jgi:Uri superfamily endonuclease